MKRRLLFLSNLFPDQAEPYRGLDNAVLLRYLRPHFQEIRALGLRPTLDPRRWGLWSPPVPERQGGDGRPPSEGKGPWTAREDDAWLQPAYLGVPYVPKLGSHLNDRVMAQFLRPALAQLQRTQPFDVILCSWLFPDGAALARLSGGAARPFALICQGSDAHQYLRIPARKGAILAAIGKSGGVVTRSADLARLLGEAGATAEKLHPIYNGVDRELFQPLAARERKALRAELGLAENDAVTLFVGNFLPVKNPRLLLDAFAQAKRDLGDSPLNPRLLMAGGGPMEAEIRAWIQELGLGNHLRLEGRMDARGIARLMQAADVLCMSSENEGVPNVVLEAQATGVPVVATDVGGIAEIIKSPTQGALTPKGMASTLAGALLDHWQPLIDPTAAEERRYRIAELGKAYAWEKTAVAYFDILQKL